MTRTTALDRLRRTLAIIPWIASHPEGASLAETCERFQIKRRDLLADLDVIFVVGRYPYSPDELIDVEIDGDTVKLRYAEIFQRPLRLTPAEGLALVAAGSVLSATPGYEPQGPLGRALTKLAAALDVDAGDALEVQLSKTDEQVLSALQKALSDRRRVEIDYYSLSHSERSIRVVDPWQLWSADGNWYLSAHCHLAGEERTFRVDRISRVLELDQDASPAPPDLKASTSLDAVDAPTAVIDLDPELAWAVEAWPVREVREVDGRRRITLAVSGPSWIERTLLQLGPGAHLISIDPRVGNTSLQADAAHRVLERYRRDQSKRTAR